MTRTLTYAAAIALVGSLAACGGRTLYGGNGNTNGNSNTNTNTNTGGECQAPSDCQIAVKTDECCACPEPASAADMAADPCLLPMDTYDIPEECLVACPAIPCQQCPVQGRTVGCSDGQCVWNEGACSQDEQCVAAIRVDMCCEQAFPATHADIAADPCLMYWPLDWTSIPQSCIEAQPEWCAIVDCAPSPPMSRAMYCASDGCAQGTECSQPADCTLLVNHRQCCPCPQSWPASMVGHDPCVLPPGQNPPPDCQPAACDLALCEQCWEPGTDCGPEGRCVDVYPFD